ncbi:hypothetical protein L7Q76_03850 [Pseudomonas aeruginosa]|uniref:hypothetical protein n=1 Tax=Pseudomonas aeruginosa TaxID=287 RepID=UPI0009A8005B|nr:hypothetical protein [Pseudomonas aeruginosa]MCG3026773.1 hypothetical protein [Pseudomonas aeruginosa]
MTKANECTCPSGDGSLRHPCPAHPASVELAGVAANLTFINGRPAMCGCQVEYSSGGGEYSDVIYVTLCAKHSGSAILDLVATNRIALTPEYEGQWHADLYLDREIPLAKADGATPAEAVLALMSAERIDPEQESVEQAGGDERVIGWRERILAAHPNSDPGFWPDALLVEHMAAEIADLRAALAQPSPTIATAPTYQFHSREIGESDWAPCDFSWYLYCSKSPEMDTRVVEVTAQPSPAQARSTWPKLEKPAQVGGVRFSAGVSSRLVVEAAQRLYEFESTPEKEAERIERLQAFREQLDPLNLAPHAKAFNEAPAEALKSEQAEAERPEVVAWRYGFSGGIVSDKACLDEWKSGGEYQSLMTVAQHERIVGALRFERQQMDRAFTACINERDAANARLHEVATACATAEQERDAALARVAELERGKVYVEARRCDECQHGGINDSATGVAACHECDWAGPEPEEDKCPGCQRENCMAAACPQCGARYVLVASEEIAAPVAQAQQLHDLDKQCRDDVARALGLRPNEERGFAWSYLLASIKSCVKAAQAQHSVPEGWMLVECGIWTQEQVDEMQRTVARFRSSEFVDDRALAMAVADAGQCKAPEISLAELLAAAPGKEVGHE